MLHERWLLVLHWVVNFFLFWPALLLGQGSDLSYSFDLRLNCGNTGSFNQLCWARDRTCVLALQRCHQPIAPQGNLALTAGSLERWVVRRGDEREEASSTRDGGSRHKETLRGVETEF